MNKSNIVWAVYDKNGSLEGVGKTKSMAIDNTFGWWGNTVLPDITEPPGLITSTKKLATSPLASHEIFRYS